MKRLNRERKVLLAFVAGLAFVVILLGLVVANRVIASRRADAEITSLRAAGFALTVAELRQHYRDQVPDSDGGEWYRRGEIALQAVNAVYADDVNLPIFGAARLPAPGDEVPAVMAERIGAFYADSAEARKFFEEAVRADGVRWDLSGDLYALPFLDLLSSMRVAARLQVLTSVHHALENRSGEATDAALAAFAIAGHLREAPFLINALVRIAITNIALQQVEHLLAARVLTAENLGRLQEALLEADDDYLYPGPLAGELVFGGHYFDLVAGMGGLSSGAVDTQVLAGIAYSVLGQLERDRYHYYAGMRDLISRAKGPLPNRVRSAPAASAATAMFAAVDELPDLKTLLRGDWLTSGLLANADMIFASERDLLRNLRATLVAVTAVRFERLEGKRPETLGDLKSLIDADAVQDPATGLALEFSFGEDGGLTVTADGEPLLQVPSRTDEDE